MDVDKFCGKKVFVCKTRKCLWEQCFLKTEVIHRKWINPVHKIMSACEITFLNVDKWRFQIYKIAQ